ncbi:MAG: radical SAM protein, partial [Spirochaetaceae bacterium]|nr:radical SAM protein [Spirochaetaceae bacterium]
GILGAGLLKVFAKIGITVDFIIDQNAEELKQIHNIPVYKSEYGLLTLEGRPVFLAVSRRTALEIEREHEKFKHNFYDGLAAQIILQSALCSSTEGRLAYKECYDCGILDSQCKALRNNLIENKGITVSEKNKSHSQKALGYILGQICSLNCKYCCESIPYLPRDKRHQLSSYTVLKDIRQFAAACEFLTFVEFIGGEPFLHKELADILKGVLCIPNIGLIHIFTNGTVLPAPELCETLSNTEIVVYISNYTKELSPQSAKKVEETEKQLIKYGVNFCYGYGKKWFDFSKFAFECDDPDTLANNFTNCIFHSCNRLFDGKFYQCPHHYGSDMLNIIPDDNDILHIHNFTSCALARELEKKARRKYINACKYCAMPFNAKLVQPGIQYEA